MSFESYEQLLLPMYDMIIESSLKDYYRKNQKNIDGFDGLFDYLRSLERERELTEKEVKIVNLCLELGKMNPIAGEFLTKKYNDNENTVPAPSRAAKSTPWVPRTSKPCDKKATCGGKIKSR